MYLLSVRESIVKLHYYTHVGVNVSTYIYHNRVYNFGAEVFDHIFALIFKAEFLFIVLVSWHSLCSLN